MPEERQQSKVWDDFYKRFGRAWRGSARLPIPNSGKALDLGCGNGKSIDSLLDAGYVVYGVDFSKRAINGCRELFPDAHLEVSDVCSLPFGDEEFDYITAVHILENLDDEQLAAAVGEIRRTLKKGGYVFVRCFTDNDMRSSYREKLDIFYRFYDIDSIIGAFMGFEVMSSELKEFETKFGTTRSRIEVMMKK